MSEERRILCSTRKAWIQLLGEVGDYDMFMTVGFSVWLDRKRAVSCLEHLLLRLNRSLYGKGFRRTGFGLSGIVVCETKRCSSLAPSGIHFHMLLRTPRPIEISSVRELLCKHAERLRFLTGNASRPLGRSISGRDFVDAQPIEEVWPLLDYLTKELRYQRHISRGISIGFVDIDGVIGITC